jgi:hypothetical protein
MAKPAAPSLALVDPMPRRPGGQADSFRFRKPDRIDITTER